MNIKSISTGAAAIALAASFFASQAGAVPVLCQDTTRNHMYVDSAYVSSCVDAGVGNINGNPITDDFLLSNPALNYVGIGSGTWGQADGDSFGTFGLNSALWDTWSSIAIGFKFGTGNQPDEWFIYLLNPLVTSGAWDFVNVFD